MRCFVNIPVLGREPKEIEKSTLQMLDIARARWGENVEVCIACANDGKTLLNNVAKDIHYISANIDALKTCDCAITVVDPYCCEDCDAINIIGNVIAFMGIPTVAIHCSDWFTDAIKSMTNVAIC